MEDQNFTTTTPVLDEDKKGQNNQADEEKKKIEEYLNQLKRIQADFINYRKDEAKRLEEIIKFANESLVLELLDSMDDIETALKHDSENRGMVQIFKKMQDLVGKYGVKRIDTSGTFDPMLQEALVGEGDKMEELRAGYTMHGKVIRPARVRLLQ